MIYTLYFPDGRKLEMVFRSVADAKAHANRLSHYFGQIEFADECNRIYFSDRPFLTMANLVNAQAAARNN
jgi:hypothetical protein